MRCRKLKYAYVTSKNRREAVTVGCWHGARLAQRCVVGQVDVIRPLHALLPIVCADDVLLPMFRHVVSVAHVVPWQPCLLAATVSSAPV